MALQLDGNTGITYNTLNQDIKSLLLPKNWIINGMFDVWQRGTNQTSVGYGSDDRWSNYNDVSTKTHTREPFTVGQTTVPNNPKYFSRTVVTSGGTSLSYATKTQSIEDVTKLAGKNVALSFWAKADANRSIVFELRQRFGTGGSASVSGIGLQKLNLTTSWQRFTKIIILPSISGKTIGADSSTQLQFWFDAGSGYASATDSLGNQSGTFDIANVSLVEGSVAVECQNQPHADVLRDCQRYCYDAFGNSVETNSTYSHAGIGFATSASQAMFNIDLPKNFRTKPISLIYSGTFNINWSDNSVNTSSIGLDGSRSSARVAAISANCAGGLTTYRPAFLIRFNDASARLLIESEL